jgi:hypothetical protein
MLIKTCEGLTKLPKMWKEWKNVHKKVEQEHYKGGAIFARM